MASWEGVRNAMAYKKESCFRGRMRRPVDGEKWSGWAEFEEGEGREALRVIQDHS